MRIPSALARSARRAALPTLLLLLAAPLPAQYQDHRALTATLQSLAQRDRARTELVTVATSPGGRAVQALRVGAANRPALLVVANAHGPHLVGSAAALAAAEALLNGSAAGVLDRATVWFVPRLNPDAAEAMFAKPLGERTGNGMATDDDRDWELDEDAGNDLNGDGLLTAMRIADPNGDWLEDAEEPGLMRRADAAKGEVGKWRLLTEGTDDDGDKRYNEDGPGGVDVNRNFPYNYPHHGIAAGRFPMESPEARGLAEFVMAHPEIAAIYVMGPEDNLLKAWENRPNAGIMNATTRERATEGTSAGGQLNSILRADQNTFAELARRFQATTGLSKGPASAALAGDVLSWSYFNFGRWSAGSRVWWAPEVAKDTTKGTKDAKDTKDTTAAGGARPSGGGGTPGGRASGGSTDANADERTAIKWYRSIGQEAVVPWTAVKLPGESAVVEVGGLKPGVLLNPPAGSELDSALSRQSRFVAELAGMLPRIALRDLKVESVGEGVWRITVELANEGALPTNTALGSRMRNPRNVRVALDLRGATLLSGQAIQVEGPIAGGGRSSTLAWTVGAARGATLSLLAESPTTGSITQTITLR
ncbi:MAG: M14 family metallopeptidase [Gemmatimonadales bacterium]|nr:M14 family metallopeptidase [Gemmatimonadales bacterium]